MKCEDLDYKKLELLDEGWFPNSWLAKLSIATVQLGHAILNFFAPVDDIHIWERCNRAGEVTFYVREQRTGRRWRFSSEDDLRIWLEERHHQN